MLGFGLIALLASALQVTPALDDSSREIWGYECQVERKLKHGEILIMRWFPDSGYPNPDGEDFVKWDPAGSAPDNRMRLLEADFYFGLPVDGPATIDPREIDLRLVVGIDTDLPQVVLIHMQRPFPVKPYGIIGSTALTTMMFPYSRNDPKNGHGELPLGDLLAYGEGYDDLAWTLVRPSDQLGGDRTLASGRINILAFREAMRAVPQIRKALIAKATNPKRNCERMSKMPPPIVY